jgi:hypothetical protein
MARGRHTSLSVSLTAADRQALESWRRSTTIGAGLANRARVILCISEGLSVTDTAFKVGIARRLVYKWVDRFNDQGLNGLRDRPRPGRPPFFSSRNGGAFGQTRLRAA